MFLQCYLVNKSLATFLVLAVLLKTMLVLLWTLETGQCYLILDLTTLSFKRFKLGNIVFLNSVI